jgi:hypothetical protein
MAEKSKEVIMRMMHLPKEGGAGPNLTHLN